MQSVGGALVSDPAGKAALLRNFFDGEQSRDVVDCPTLAIAGLNFKH